MTGEVDSLVEDFLQNDRVRLSKAPLYVQEETNLIIPSVADFYKSQNVLITGATGFLGGILVEKILRSCPDVDTVYLLIRENKKTAEDAKCRLKKLLSSPIFGRTDESALRKVEAIVADVSLPGLGLSAADCQTLRNRVNVVFHVAASLNFNSPLLNAMRTNVLGTRRVLGLCQIMKHVKALVYVSTAYCNCTQRSVIAEQIYPTTHDPDRLMAQLAKMSPQEIADATPSILCGHPNTYSFTKLLAENLILKERGSVPVAIVRPSIVLGTLKEPVEGWVDNVNNGAFAFIAGAGKGVFRVILADGRLVADMVPCDQVVNLMISAASHIPFSDEGLKVFHITSGTKNPLRWHEYAELTVQGIHSSPCLYPVWIPGARCRTNLTWAAFKLLITHYIPAIVLYIYGKLKGKTHILLGIQNKYVRGMLLSKYFTVNEWQFNTENTDTLARSLSPTDFTTFNFDVTQIAWPKYLKDCTLGVKRFFHKEDETVDQRAFIHHSRTWWIDWIAKAVMCFAVLYICNNLTGNQTLSLLLGLLVTYVSFYV